MANIIYFFDAILNSSCRFRHKTHQQQQQQKINVRWKFSSSWFAKNVPHASKNPMQFLPSMECSNKNFVVLHKSVTPSNTYFFHTHILSLSVCVCVLNNKKKTFIRGNTKHFNNKNTGRNKKSIYQNWYLMAQSYDADYKTEFYGNSYQWKLLQ